MRIQDPLKYLLKSKNLKDTQIYYQEIYIGKKEKQNMEVEHKLQSEEEEVYEKDLVQNGRKNHFDLEEHLEGM